MVGIIDYNAGNIRSVEHALNHLGIPNLRSGDPRELVGAEKLLFPGVGNAGYAMEQLRKTGLGSLRKGAAGRGVPILGICLGSQIIFDYSEEGDIECLGLVPGAVRHLKQVWLERPDASAEAKSGLLKAPHMGWNDVPGWGAYYFVHSYIICPKDAKVVVGAADYGVPVPAGIRSGNIMATQFHPEKSGEAGLRLLKDFCAGKLEGN